MCFHLRLFCPSFRQNIFPLSSMWSGSRLIFRWPRFTAPELPTSPKKWGIPPFWFIVCLVPPIQPFLTNVPHFRRFRTLKYLKYCCLRTDVLLLPGPN